MATGSKQEPGVFLSGKGPAESKRRAGTSWAKVGFCRAPQPEQQCFLLSASLNSGAFFYQSMSVTQQVVGESPPLKGDLQRFHAPLLQQDYATLRFSSTKNRTSPDWEGLVVRLSACRDTQCLGIRSRRAEFLISQTLTEQAGRQDCKWNYTLPH